MSSCSKNGIWNNKHSESTDHKARPLKAGFIFNRQPPAASGGTLKRYDNETLMTNVYNKWIHVNVQHDADNGKIYVYLNGSLKGTFADRGSTTHYFKCGVYNITGSRSETHWKNIKNWINGPVGQ
jgi:hypothetical protein